MYKCEKCSKTFNSKYLLDRHSNKKIPCESEKNIQCNEKKLPCEPLKKQTTENEENNDDTLTLKNKISEISKIIVQYGEKINEIESIVAEKNTEHYEISKKIIALDKKILKYEEKFYESDDTCSFCKKKLVSKYNLTRHISNSCPAKMKLIDQREDLFNKKEELSILMTELTDESDGLIEKREVLIKNKEYMELSIVTMNNLKNDISCRSEINFMYQLLCKYIKYKIMTNNLQVNIHLFDNLPIEMFVDFIKYNIENNRLINDCDESEEDDTSCNKMIEDFVEFIEKRNEENKLKLKNGF